MSDNRLNELWWGIIEGGKPVCREDSTSSLVVPSDPADMERMSIGPLRPEYAKVICDALNDYEARGSHLTNGELRNALFVAGDALRDISRMATVPDGPKNFAAQAAAVAIEAAR